MNQKKKWIYQMRGMAILGVVVCHQQGFLHQSEWIQLFTLYSVSMLILCAGITRAYSLQKYEFSAEISGAVMQYMIKSLCTLLCSYTVAAIIMMIWNGENLSNYLDVINGLLSFNAAGPFYFLKYYITLTILSPVPFLFIQVIKKCKIKLHQLLYTVLFLFITFLIGYLSIGKLDIMGQSYLFVYCLGIVLGCTEMKFISYKGLPIYIIIWILGFISVKRFYFARVAGDLAYAGGINKYTSKLQLNPPNLSTILYTLGCFLLFYILFEAINHYRETKCRIKIVTVPFEIIGIMGKYSLDIFLWHLFIQYVYIRYFNHISNILLTGIVAYSCMFFLPVFGRVIYNKSKSILYTYLCSSKQETNHSS